MLHRTLPRFAIPLTTAALLPLALLFSAGAVYADQLGRTDPNQGLFPDSSLVDFRHLLDAPAGKHGFLQSKGGHFCWPSGERARFWGVNISSGSVWIDHKRIETVADVLARAGCNMVRLEALDSTGGLLDVPGSDSSRKLNPDRLATLDYWTWQLKKRGIYYYIDLLDFRQFKSGDGVDSWDQLGRAAKPYAFFDPGLIELQKELARELLTHKNPHTGLRYVDDPALALVEICNEHGLFMKSDMLDALADPYAVELRRMWGKWLLRRYGSRDALKAAWGKVAGVDVLGASEDPASGTVALPLFTQSSPQAPNEPDVRRSPARLSDGVRFLYDTQRAYFHEMRDYLREIGLKVPVTGVVSNDTPPDVASAAAELDFTSENYYADHPAFDGKEWQGLFYYNDTNPLTYGSTYQIAPWLSALRWQNKPVVVREWATVWPNRYRAIAMPEMAAYASLQDFDAVLLFGYQTERNPERLSDFDHQADPTVWGLFGLAAQAFLRGDIHPSPFTATIRYTSADLFRWPNRIGGLYRLAWFVRVNSVFAPDMPAPPTIAANNGASRRASRRSRLASRGGRQRGSPRAALNRRKDLVVSAADSDAVPRLLNLYGQAGATVDASLLTEGVLAASTGEIVRKTREGILRIQTPRTVAICGDLPTGKAITFGGWTLVTPTTIGALMAVSLDGKPLAQSRRFVVKMVSRAENTDQSLEASQPGAPAKWHLQDWGKAPVLTFGQPSASAMRLKRGRTDVLSLALQNGTWELYVRDGEATVVCDTPGIRGTLFGRALTTTDGTPITMDIGVTRHAGR